MRNNIVATSLLALLAVSFEPFALPIGSAAQDVDPAELVKDIHAIFGEHHERAVHAKGVVLEAVSSRREEARALSKASVFAGKVRATARLSDTTGIPTIPDADPNASPARPGDQVHCCRRRRDGHRHPQLQRLSRRHRARLRRVPEGGGGQRRRRGQAHADREIPSGPPEALPFVTQQKPPPESLATTTYFGVNAFAFTDAGGKKTTVRYRFVPQAGEKYLDAAAAASKGPNYLMEEIAERVGKGPVAFDWYAQIARPATSRMTPRAHGRRIGNW